MKHFLEAVFGRDPPTGLSPVPRLGAGPLSRMPDLDVPELHDRRLLFALPGATTKIYLPREGGTGIDIAIVPATQGQKLYAAGHSVNVEYIHEFLPQVARFGKQLAVALGAVDCVASAFMGPPGNNVPAHQDPLAVVVVQITGQKEWRIAPPEAAGIDASAAHFDLFPGSVLFVPRLHWHSTKDVGAEPALSVSFVLKAPSWAEVWSDGLRRSLASAFELPAILPHATPGQRRESLALFVEEGTRARDEFAAFSIASLLPPFLHPHPGDHFRRRAGVALSISEGRLCATENGETVFEVAVPSTSAAAAAWLSDSASLEPSELAQRLGYPQGTVDLLVKLLVCEGVLELME